MRIFNVVTKASLKGTLFKTIIGCIVVAMIFASGYAYENGLTNGVSDTLFGSGNSANANMYLTFVLRSLGYSDKNGDFSWDSPFDLAGSVNITTDNLALNNFLRGDVVLISVNALEAKMKGSDQTLASRLIKAGVFTSTQYQAAFSK